MGTTMWDLSRPFNCFSHDILLGKLHYYGITGVTLELIQTYLSNIFLVLLYNNCESPFREVKLDVPLGSVFGPLLFIVYVNDLTPFLSPSWRERDMVYYANRLKLNKDKTQQLILTANIYLQEDKKCEATWSCPERPTHLVKFYKATMPKTQIPTLRIVYFHCFKPILL